ncbi:MAG: hypothetical protein AABW51_04245 [Nanoarchaeota archaeon]
MEHLRSIARSKKRKTFYVISAIIFAVAILILFLEIFVSKYYRVLERSEVSTSLSIGSGTGFNITKDSVSFGMLSLGNAAFRNDLILINNYKFPIYVKFFLDGDIKDFLIFEKKIYLQPGESKNVSISTITITDEPYGFYSGEFTLVYKRDFNHNNS